MMRSPGDHIALRFHADCHDASQFQSMPAQPTNLVVDCHDANQCRVRPECLLQHIKIHHTVLLDREIRDVKTLLLEVSERGHKRLESVEHGG